MTAPTITMTSLSEIMDMQSCDYSGTVRNALQFKCVHGEYYNELRNVMIDGGPTAIAPVCVEGNGLWEGHHRVKIAVELGWLEIATTTSMVGCSDYSYGSGHHDCGCAAWRTL